MLTQETNGRLRNRQCVSRIDATFGKSRSVGFLARIVHMKHGTGDNGRINHIHGSGVDHHGGMDVLKCATFQKEDFAAGISNFFRWRAQYADGQADFIRYLSRSNPGANSTGCNNIMTTGMADTGQAVVFSTDGNVQRPAAGPRDKSGRHVTNPGFNAKAGVAQRFGNPGGSLFFFKTKLGMGMNTMTQSNEVVLRLREAFLSARLRIHSVLLIFPLPRGEGWGEDFLRPNTPAYLTSSGR